MKAYMKLKDGRSFTATMTDLDEKDPKWWHYQANLFEMENNITITGSSDHPMVDCAYVDGVEITELYDMDEPCPKCGTPAAQGSFFTSSEGLVLDLGDVWICYVCGDPAEIHRP